MGCNCGGRKAKEALTAAAQEAQRQNDDLARRMNEETAKASESANR